jgi:hypothetical protein
MGTEIDGVNGIIKNTTSDGDITIKGNDGGSEISALVLDMSAQGAATFNVGFTAQAASTITTADNTDTLSLISTDADANAGPILVLNRDSGSPADNDFLGHIKFVGDDDAGNATTFFEILTKSADVSDGSEDSRVEFNAMVAGSAISVMQVRQDGFVFNQDSADYDFRVESNGNTHALFVDAGNNEVSIGNSNPNSFNTQARNLVVGTGSGANGITIYSGNDSSGNIFFADGTSGDDPTRGGVNYNHSSNELSLRINDSPRLTIADGGPTTINTAGNEDTLTLTSTDADANNGPKFVLNRDSGSPADGDNCGIIKFKADDDGGNSTELVNISAAFTDVSNGSEDATFNISSVIGGSQMGRIGMSPTETVFNDDSGDIDFRVESDNNTHALFVQGSSGKVGMGESSPLCSNGGLHIKSGDSGATANSNADELVLESSSATGLSILSGNSSTGNIFFSDDGDNNVAEIQYNHSSNHLAFNVNAGERMRITSAGQVSLGTSSPVGSSRLFFYASASTPYGLITQNDATSGSMYAAQFLQNDGSTELGSIKITNTGTAFNTSSDYRLKENVSYDFDATTRLKQLKPSRFNFIADADTTVDGFLAHEVSSIVPEAISGDKDATETKTKVVVNSSGFVINQDVEEAEWTAGKVADDNGNTRYPTDSTWEASKVVPVYQGIDQSKLVPLMVKTIQELARTRSKNYQKNS